MRFLFFNVAPSTPVDGIHRMLRTRASIFLGIPILAGCSGEGRTAGSGAQGELARSELTIEAVDATTGSSLVDDTFTIRYLARAPITLDATAVEAAAASASYRIGHSIREDSLVLEVRLEAPSYQRLDTVLAVARGASVGPILIPLTPVPARATEGRVPSGAGPSSRPAEDRPGEATATGTDRTFLEAGDRAFGAGNWSGAVTAYDRMPRPGDREGAYALEYELALVRKGISHINLGQWQDAHDVLQEAVAFDFREYTAFFYLGQVQCVLGQYDAGRQSLEHIQDWLTLSISEAQRPIVLTLIDYQLAMCTYGETRQARTQSELGRLRARAREEFEAFILRAEGLTPVPPEVQAALTDAQQRLAEIRLPRP